MTGLNPLQDFSGPTTRQTLFDMWSTAALTSIGAEDLAQEFIPIRVGSDFSNAPAGPVPGQLFWHQTDALMFVWTDVLDGTGVSLWLAIGPDRFDVAALTTMPVPAAFPVGLLRDRLVAISNPLAQHGNLLGFNQSGINNGKTINDVPYGGETAASGAWIRVAVDGIVYGKIDNALSNPSNAATWAEAFLILDQVPGREGSIARAATNFSYDAPTTHGGIGSSIERPFTTGTQTATEPSHIFKFQLTPRKAF